jgi:hypothetical protein
METDQRQRESLPNRLQDDCAIVVRKGESKYD